MRRLKIRNVGPLRDVDIELKRINVVIGPQCSGKSCLLKIACHCYWAEKRIELEQGDERFREDGRFLEELARFHKLDGFFRSDSYMEYESDLMRFSYDNATKTFGFDWKDGRWDYKRTKLCYIPAERNLVAVIPNWYDVKFSDNNIRDFMSDWENARKATGDFPILDLGVKYHYDPGKRADMVQLEGGETLDFTNASSGLQSVIPLCGLLQYFFGNQFTKETLESVGVKAEHDNIAKLIHHELFGDVSRTEHESIPQNGAKKTFHVQGSLMFTRVGDIWFAFRNSRDADSFREYCSRYTKVDHCDIFLEEPEMNLFPTTQNDLLNWLVAQANGERKHSLFIATHSPYVMTSINILLEAGRIVAEDGEKMAEVEKIVPRERMLTTDDIGAYSIEDGVACSMIDEESKLISADRLDDVSDIMDRKFNELLWP